MRQNDFRVRAQHNEGTIVLAKLGAVKVIDSLPIREKETIPTI